MLRPYLVDTHCHLGDAAFDADRDAVLARARDAGVSHVVVTGESRAGSERAAALTRGTSGLSATAGVHPHEAREWSDAARDGVRALLAAPETVAVGETGLDYHYLHSPRDMQRNAFQAQLELAADLDKPVIVHARDADADMEIGRAHSELQSLAYLVCRLLLEKKKEPMQRIQCYCGRC